MSFIDTLNGDYSSEEKQERVLMREKAFEKFISDLEDAIKRESTEAAKKRKHVLSGFCTHFHGGYNGEPYFGFVDKWEDSPNCTKVLTDKYGSCPNIYRIDRLDGGLIECRYGGRRGVPSLRNTVTISLRDEEVALLCSKIETMIKGLGFSQYIVQPESRDFYLIEEKTSHGFFGMKTKAIKHDDGEGKILYIEVKW